MNSKLTFGLGFIFGGAIGAGITYVLMWKKQQKDNEELFKMVDQEEEDLKKRVIELENMMDINSFYDDSKTEINPIDSEPKQNIGVSESNTMKTDYTQYYDIDEDDLADEEFPQDDAPPIDPYIISYTEFVDENPFYSKAHLTYYEADDVLTDEHDEMIDDIYGNIGDSALHSFGDNPDDPDIVYVRNDNRSMDYEITRVEGSYQEIVLGIYDKE